MRRALVAVLGLVLVGCGASDRNQPPARTGTAGAPHGSEATQPAPVMTRDEVLSRLRAAGYDPAIRETPRFTSAMERGLAGVEEPPLSHFFLSVDQEAMIAFEFATMDLAKHMARTQEDGFRCRNWFFGGAITVDLTREMRQALGD